MFTFLFSVIVILAVLIIIRVILAVEVWERILSFNLASSLIILLIIMYAVIKDISYFIDIAIVYTMFSYIGIIFISRYIQGRGDL